MNGISPKPYGVTIPVSMELMREYLGVDDIVTDDMVPGAFKVYVLEELRRILSDAEMEVVG